MAEEVAAPQIRERVWVTKVDKTTEPPTVVEEIMVENGVVVARQALACTACGSPETQHRVYVGRDERRYCTPCWMGGVARALFETLNGKSAVESVAEGGGHG